MTALKDFFYGWEGLNLRLFHAINDNHGKLYDGFMLLGTQLSSRVNFPIYLAVMLMVAMIDRRHHTVSPNRRIYWNRIIAVYVLAFLVDCLFLESTKHIFHYPRPYAVLPPETMRIIGSALEPSEAYVSFPSGHASFAMLLVVSLWPILNNASKILACFYVGWACWSRVALGAHFPVDVLAGAFSCLLIALVVRSAVNRIISSRTRMT